MPNIVRSTKWFVRVDGSHEFIKSKVNELRTVDLKRICVILHMGSTNEHPHAHMVIELTSELQKQSFDVRIKKIFDVSKKTQYSSKVWDGGKEALAYMFHENTEPVLNVGFSQQEINEAKEHNQITQKVIAVNKEKTSNKLLDKILNNVDDKSELSDIIKVGLDLVKEGSSYYPGDFKFKQIIQDAYIKTRSKEDWCTVSSHMVNAFENDIKKYW